MNDRKFDTVLLVCDDADYAASVLDRLYSKGYGVVGLASTARLALALAAQSCPTIALVARPPAGERDAAELAHELMRTWGVSSLILDEAGEAAVDHSVAPWAPRPSQVERLRRALADQDLQPAHGQ
jgi:hypothetical protein